MEEPYVGLSDIVSSEIAEDVTVLRKSEQVPTVCALGVRVNRDYSAKRRAASLFSFSFFRRRDDDGLEKHFEIQSVSGLLADGMTPDR